MGLPYLFLALRDLRAVSSRAALLSRSVRAVCSVPFPMSYVVWKKWPASVERDIVVVVLIDIFWADVKFRFAGNSSGVAG
jgi:hypothetical protein